MPAEALQVAIYLNQGGLRDADGVAAGERPPLFKRSTPQNHLIREVTFHFDPGNPRAMIRNNRDRQKAVICIQSASFELSPDWFERELSSALRAKSRSHDTARVLKAGDGQVLCDATKAFLGFVGGELSKMNLAAVEQRRRFVPRGGNGTASLALDLSCGESPSPETYQTFLWLWWLTLDRLHEGIRRALLRQTLSDDREIRAARATVLKLRAHLALGLLESRGIDDRKLLGDLHDSMLDWIDFNLGTRTSDDDLEFLEPRHEELGDLLFTVKPAPPLLQWLSRLAPRRGNGRAMAAQDWRLSRRIAVREAIFSVQRLEEEHHVRDLAERYSDSLRRATELFSSRFDVRELVTVSSAWTEIHRAPAGRAPVARRAAARLFIQGTWRHLPWLYPAILLWTAASWLVFGLWAFMAKGHSGSLEHVRSMRDFMFSIQFSVVYLLLSLFILSGLAGLARMQRLFTQALPRIFGSLIVGYVPLWIAEETWTFPFEMDWGPILISAVVLLVISFLYFTIEVSRKVKLRGEAIQKASAVFLIAAVQAYCVGLLITDFTGRYCIRAMPFAFPKQLHDKLFCAGEILPIKSPFSAINYEFWLLPKLLVFWFGLAMFIAVFLHMLWEKEGILERS
jgi:hypothetical protein